MAKLEFSKNKSCRTCLQRSDHQMYSLSSHNVKMEGERTRAETLDLAEIYNQCTQLLYEQTDSHWQWICKHCYDKLIDFFKFRKMCIESFNTFRDKELDSLTMLRDAEMDFKVEMVDVGEDMTNYLEADDGSIPDEDIDNDDSTGNFFDEESLDSGSQFDPKDEEYFKGKQNDSLGSKVKSEQNSETNVDTTGQVAPIDTVENTAEDDPTDSEDSDEEFDPKAETTPASRNNKSKSSSTVAKRPSTSDSIFTCDVCSKKFFKKHRYEAHQRIHAGLKQWQCEHCEKSFKKYSTMKNHISSSHYDESEGQPRFVCDFEGCGKSYTLKESLRVHIQQIHMGRKIKNATKVICELCGKSFGTNNALQKHTYTHTKVTPHKCHVCPKMFATSYKLKEHLMRHEGIKNFVCPTCGLRKTTGHELRVHMKYHSTDIQFPCTLCSLVFTRPANMKRHMRVVHCGIKAFPCPHCDRSFGKAETLKHHVMTHTGERPLACSICEKRFIQPIALKTHMKTHNKKK